MLLSIGMKLIRKDLKKLKREKLRKNLELSSMSHL